MLEEYRKANEEWYKRNHYLTSQLQARGILVVPEFKIQNYRGTEHEGGYVEALMASLDHAPNESDLHSYVALLCGTTTPYRSQPLIEIFEQHIAYPMRSAVVHTLAQSRPFPIAEWFIIVLRDDALWKYGGILACLISYSENPEQYLPVLRERYPVYPMNAIQTFYDIGGPAELEFLKSVEGQLFDLPPNKYKDYLKLYAKTVARLERQAQRKKR